MLRGENAMSQTLSLFQATQLLPCDWFICNSRCAHYVSGRFPSARRCLADKASIYRRLNAFSRLEERMSEKALNAFLNLFEQFDACGILHQLPNQPSSLAWYRQRKGGSFAPTRWREAAVGHLAV